MTTPHPTKSAPAPSVTYTELPDFDTVEQRIYAGCRRFISVDMLEPIHNLIRDAIDADRAMRAQAATAAQDASDALARLRHIYTNLKNGGVRDTAQAKSIADSLLGPVIESLERAQAAPAAVAEQGPVAHDEDLLELLYWEFDAQRSKTGEERLAFKVKMRFYASEFRRRSDGKMTFAQSVSDDMMNLADRLGSEYDDVDPRAWKHLLVYAPQAAPAAVASPLTKLQRKAIAVCFTSDKVSVSEVQRKLSQKSAAPVRRPLE